MHFDILNKKDYTKILEKIEKQFDTEKLVFEYGFIQIKDKIYLISRDLARINYKDLRINNIGLYFCTLEKDGIRMSIEGSQLIGNKAKKVLELDNGELKLWLSGIPIENKKGSGYYLVKNGNDFYGCGKIKENILHNYVPKERRIKELIL
ncbi:MAG: hypothetical protein PHD81_03990 [Candidatus Nanoarchaeia archaeon]|nr:hypothetical protein [Candidatus Nanoarchaeia archaeon]MDD5588242.1 hypothetical protein [Candidatus Nanoarchaeia archaeon]